MIFLLLLIFLLTSCDSKNDVFSTDTIYYNLDVSKIYSEKIIFPFSYKDYNSNVKGKSNGATYVTMKNLLINGDISPISLSSKKYIKDVIKNGDKVKLLLSYDYLESEFLKESYIEMCFENYDLKSASDYFEISLSGEYYCKNDFSKLVINVSNKNYVLESNGIETNNGYSWVIDDGNYNNVNIHYKFSRDYDSMAKKVESKDVTKKRIISIFKFILIVGVFVILCKTYNKYKSLGV